jgi:hypothetical protein
VVLNRRWAYRELFDSEEDAARAYDGAIWRLRPRDARSYVNFKDSCPQDVAEVLQRAFKVRATTAGCARPRCPCATTVAVPPLRALFILRLPASLGGP